MKKPSFLNSILDSIIYFNVNIYTYRDRFVMVLKYEFY